MKHALGPDYLVDAREASYLELGCDYSSWTVAFQSGRAVLVSTTRRTQHTAADAGPGALWPRIVRAYPGGRCTFNFLPEFAAGWRDQCADGWEKATVPRLWQR